MNKLNTNTQEINDLKNNGYNVKIKHFRYHDEDWRNIPHKRLKNNQETYLMGHNELAGPCRAPVGGKTVMEVINKTNGGKFVVSANCSLQDQFDRKKSIQICLGRLKKQMEVQVPF